MDFVRIKKKFLVFLLMIFIFTACGRKGNIDNVYIPDRKVSEIFSDKDIEAAYVILSSFDVDSSGGDGSLDPDSTYDDWEWILIRNEGGEWEHAAHGY